ncbi:hypothetical protein BKA65DRAFT_45223 [Rhexocercosporidium sp. MPI-PUGE-AT-0058]|nr:hypothetical protein BKA65DRAFT_45223 [Rhexocercosporidium sp. MPI-PUGE-AT-0058]
MNQQAAPPANDSAGGKALYILTPIVAIGILLHLLRIFTRIIPTCRLNLSDYTSMIAVLAAIITYILFATAVSHGLGRHSVYITPENTVRILQYLYGVFIAGLLTSIFSRISVACLLLELTSSKTWKAVLWITIAFQLASLLSILPLEVFQCRPIRKFWEPVAGGKCISPAVMWTLGYVSNTYLATCCRPFCPCS